MVFNYNTIRKNKNSDTAVYLCGPTVYTHLHIGNYRSIVFMDVFCKINKFDFYIGVTDISDKIENILCNEPYQNFSGYIREFYNSLNILNIQYADLCPVSENIASIDSVINLLDNKKEVIQDSSQVRLKVGHTAHYALWKKNKLINFYSIYGSGHPGWHVECVAHVYALNKVYDKVLHGGGIDLKNTHHKYENMIFNSLGLNIEWVHIQNLNTNYVKMSKSKGNTKYLSQYDSYFARYILLSEDSDTPIELNDATMLQKKRQYQKLITKIYSSMYLNEPQKVQINLDLIKTGSVMRALNHNFSLKSITYINQFYKIVSKTHLEYNKDIEEKIKQYNCFKLENNYTQCDSIKLQLLDKYHIMYNGKILTYIF